MLFSIYKMMQADKNNAKADSINIRALNKLGEAERALLEQETKTRQSIEKLANRKKGILSTSLSEFITLYEKIMQIDFNESDEIKCLLANSMTPSVIQDMRTAISTIGYALTPQQTLATALLGGLLGGGLFGAVSNTVAKESQLNIDAANIRRKQVGVVISQQETTVVVLDGIFQRTERMAKLLAQLNVLFRKSLGITTEIIEKNGKSRLNYFAEEKEFIKTCLNLADAIKKIIDTPLIDENSEITQQSMQAIETGEAYLDKLQTVITL